MLGWELWDVSHFIEVYSWKYSILCSDISRASSEPTSFFHVSTKSWFLISVFNETDLSEAGLFLMSTDYGDFCRDILYKWRIICHVQSDPSRVQDVIGLMSPYQVLCPKTESKSHSTWGVFLFQSELGSSPRIRGFSSFYNFHQCGKLNHDPQKYHFFNFFQDPRHSVCRFVESSYPALSAKGIRFLSVVHYWSRAALDGMLAALNSQFWMGREDNIYSNIYILVGGLKHFLFSIIYGIDFPIDFHIFHDGYCTTNQYIYRQIYIYIGEWCFFLAYPQVWFFFHDFIHGNDPVLCSRIETIIWWWCLIYLMTRG